jgi:hypothetical protein
MSSGKTMSGKEASGGMVIVYYMDRLGPIFLMGQETTYLTETHNVTDFKSSEGKKVREAFLYKGDINNPVDLEAAKKKFGKLCKELEAFNPRFIKRVTFGDVKMSKGSPGFISAKPRCVGDDNVGRYGFTKGGYEASEDGSINDTVVRECEQETSVKLDIKRLVETKKTFSKGKAPYALYLYELSDSEYQSIHDNKTLTKKNADYENELHDIKFIRVPKMDLKKFFINSISREAYEECISDILNAKKGGRKTRRIRDKNNSKTRKDTKYKK